jgi:hypothetical protein
MDGTKIKTNTVSFHQHYETDPMIGQAGNHNENEVLMTRRELIKGTFLRYADDPVLFNGQMFARTVALIEGSDFVIYKVPIGAFSHEYVDFDSI